MKKIAIFVLAFFALATAAPAFAQEAQQVVKADKGFYAGVVAGPSFGVATFRSISDRAAAVGVKGGLELGYRFSPFFSLSLNAVAGNVPTKAMSCCNYYYHPDEVVSNRDCLYYGMTSDASLLQAVLQPNFNVVALFNQECRWAVELSPRIGCARTVATLTGEQTDGKTLNQKTAAQLHLDWGGQIQCAYALTSHLDAALFASIDFLTGDRFDAIPFHVHTENFLWDGGIKLIWNF